MSSRVGEATVALGKGQAERGESKAVGPVYRNIVSKNEWPSMEGVTTLYESFERSVKHHPDAKCLGWRPVSNGKAEPFKWHSYKETHGRVKNVASAMKAVGIKPSSKVGMYAVNCPEWMLVLQACNQMSGMCVPLYDSLGEDAVEYIINHAEASIIFTSNEKFPLLEKALPKTKENIKTVVFFGPPTDASKKAQQAAEKLGIKVYQFDEFEKMGSEKPAQASPPKPDDPACIMYTSGTTGSPKGVMLTHRNVVTAVASLSAFVKEANIPCGPDDSVLSYLTLAHILDRVVEEFALSVGGHIGYWQGDVKKLVDDVSALKPSLFVAVPRVLERMKSGIEAKVAKSGPVGATVFRLAMLYKQFWINMGYPVEQASPLLDRVVFAKTKAAFGGRVRFVVSGGAPLGPSVERFLNVSLCCPVLQGYGLTETCAASFLALPKRGHSGTVGPPAPGTEFRLEGSTELGYDPNGQPPRGEICIRGPMLFKGYYKDDEKTKESFDKDGWFHSGDVGEVTAHGCLKVIDRLKNMFKLAQGEYVAAEKLENDYGDCQLVSQVWIYGNSYESFLVAVVVPEKKELEAAAKQQGVSGSFEELCKSNKMRRMVVEELVKTGKAKKLKGFELVKAVWLHPEEFSVDNDLMTPSFKLKRPQLQRTFQKQIDQMYKETR